MQCYLYGVGLNEEKHVTKYQPRRYGVTEAIEEIAKKGRWSGQGQKGRSFFRFTFWAANQEFRGILQWLFSFFT